MPSSLVQTILHVFTAVLRKHNSLMFPVIDKPLSLVARLGLLILYRAMAGSPSHAASVINQYITMRLLTSAGNPVPCNQMLLSSNPISTLLHATHNFYSEMVIRTHGQEVPH
ncbi:unnamed protein product [Cochlearia groenlandica]